MDFMEAIAIVVPRILACGMIHGFVRVARFTQMVVDVIFVRIQATAGLNRVLNERLNGRPLHIGQHRNNDLPIALQHAKDRWFLVRQGSATTFAFQATTAAGAA